MKKVPYQFVSILSDKIQYYIEYKRALARKFDTEEYALRLFDRYIIECQITDIIQITPSVVSAFFTSRPRGTPRSYNHLLGVIRCFFDWLIAQNRIISSPVKTQPKKVTSQVRPYLFDVTQVKLLIKEASQLLYGSKTMHRNEIYPLIFTLMFALGLRVGEVTRLKKEDVDMEHRLLRIRDTKFGKSRLVPFGPKIEIQLRVYMNKCELWYGAWETNSPFFSVSADKSKAINRHTISAVFRKLMSQLNISIPLGNKNPPKLHSLRHSFAVCTLLRWYRNGFDPNSKLFKLSTFMGHTDLSSTAWYLTITDELLQEANLRFEKYSFFLKEATL